MSAAKAAARHDIGITHLMWGSDYPHPEGAWPWSRESLRRACVGTSDRDMRLVLGENAIACYGFDAEQRARAAADVGPTIDELRAPASETPAGAHLSWAFRDTDMWT